MTQNIQQELGKTLWNIANNLRGAMMADDFRDYMLSFLFWKYLSDNYIKSAKKELGSDYPVNDDTKRIPLQIWYDNNPNDVKLFEDQMRKKIHYFIKPNYLWDNIAELARTQSNDLLDVLYDGFKHIENESFGSSFKGLFSEINLHSEKLGKNYTERNALLAKVIQTIANGLADSGAEGDSLGDAYEYLMDEWYRTNVPGIYAIGDIVHGPALAHKADHEATICVEKLCGLDPKPLNYANIPGCTYTTPEIASVGLSEAKAIAAGYEVKIGKFPFTASGKATAAGNKDGFIKVVFDAKTGDWLGCHMVGDNVTEMVAAAVLCRELGAKGEDIIHAVFPHPTMSEGIMEAAAAAYNECVHL